MPVEVRELVIRATVSQDAGATANASANGGGGDNKELIAECVEQVLRLLQDKSER
jgi:hypothetical protein